MRKMLDLERVYKALLHRRGSLNAQELADAVGRAYQRAQEDVITPFVKDGAAGWEGLRETKGRDRASGRCTDPHGKLKEVFVTGLRPDARAFAADGKRIQAIRDAAVTGPVPGTEVRIQ